MKKGVLYTIGASIILIICFVAFVLPSSLSRMADQQEGLVFGKYNGKKISYEYGSDFTNFLSQYATMFRNQGQEINQSNQLTLFNYAFNSTVTKYAQDDMLKTAGYEVPQESINLKLKTYFSDEDGKFSKKAYMQADKSYIEDLTESIKESLYSDRYYDDNFGSTDTLGGYHLFGLKSADAETEFIDSFGQERRTFKMATFDTSNYPKEEQEKFGKNNSAKFTKYDMSIITVDTKELAEKVLSRISKEQITFEDAISEYSGKNYSDSDGKLTNNSQYQIENILKNPEEAAKLTALVKDEISAVVQTLMGYSIFKNNGTPVQPDFTNEDTLRDVENYITIYEKSVIEDYYSDIARKFTALAKTDGIDAAAANYENVTVEDIPAFPLNYGSVSLFEIMDTSSSTALATADKDENFLTKAFSLKLNDFSDPIIISSKIVVLQYTGDEEPETKESAEDAEATEETGSNYHTSFVNMDQNSCQQVIFQSPALENNFVTVYFDNFLNSSY